VYRFARSIYVRVVRGVSLEKTANIKNKAHLLLKYTKSGYETVLTAACACQGCSATE
jgi:hypothetical protein